MAFNVSGGRRDARLPIHSPQLTPHLPHLKKNEQTRPNFVHEERDLEVQEHTSSSETPVRPTLFAPIATQLQIWAAAPELLGARLQRSKRTARASEACHSWSRSHCTCRGNRGNVPSCLATQVKCLEEMRMEAVAKGSASTL